MSVFRINHKKFDKSDSRKKFYSEESKPTLEISKNLAQILSQTQQKTQPHNSFKRRINTLPVKDSSTEISKINRIYQTYNISQEKIQSIRNSKFNKKSSSGIKIDAVLNMNKNSEPFKSKQKKNSNKRSPKIATKLSEQFKNREKSRGKISNRLIQQVSSSKFYFPQNLTKRETKTNRIISQRSNQRFVELYQEAQGLNYYKKKNIVRALESFLECLKIQNSNSDCLYHIGSCYFNLKQASTSTASNLPQVQHKLIPLTGYKLQAPEIRQAIYLRAQLRNIPFPLILVRFFLSRYKQNLFPKQNYTQTSKIISQLQIRYRNVFLQTRGIFLLTLADAYLQLNQYNDAIELYKIVLNENRQYNTLDQKNHLSTHLKLIQLLMFTELYDDPTLDASFQYCQIHLPQSHELLFFKLQKFYQTKQQLMPKQIQSLMLNLNYCFHHIENEKVNIQCMKLMLRILIDTKDLYKAEDTLKIIQKQTGIIMQKQIGRQKNLTEWRLFIQGANDIIKQKDSQGKKKLTLCIQRLNPQNKIYTSHPNSISNPYKDYIYLKHNALEYLGYVEFKTQNIEGTLKAYEQILKIVTHSSHYQSLTDPTKTSITRFSKKYHHKFKTIEINKIIVQSIKEYLQNQNYLLARKGFSLALSHMQTPQRLFIWVINQVAILKHQLIDLESKQDKRLNEARSKWSEVIEKLNKAEEISPHFSLIFFFHSLVLLYLKYNKRALQKVKQAIERIEDPISEYHYIESLCYFLISMQEKNINFAYQGLQGINKAIQIDSKMPEFFKQRSKHYFCLGRYQDALRDVIIVQLQNNDYEAKLLSMFYHYLCGNYHQSYKFMNQLLLYDQKQQVEQQQQRQCDNEDGSLIINSNFTCYYEHFEQALMFRLNKYEKTGKISQLLIALVNSNKEECIKQLNTSYLHQLNEILQNRQSYSQFTIYFINLLMGVYFLYQQDYQMCMFYLFACLAEIQVEEEQSSNKSMKMGKLEENQSQCSHSTNKTLKNDIQSMLSEVKYNVILSSLLKSYEYHIIDSKISSKLQQQYYPHNHRIQTSYKETLTFINSFTRQSESPQLLKTLYTIRNLIQSSSLRQNQLVLQQPNSLQQDNKITVYLKPFFQSQMFSDHFFDDITIPIGDKYIMITKPIVYYPQKLTFSIKPEFDNGFLFNFGLDKVDNKLTPPWYKLAECFSRNNHSHQLVFTDQIRNQSISLTSTTKNPSIISNRKSSQPQYRYYNQSANRLQTQRECFTKISYSKRKQDRQMVRFKQNVKLNKKILKQQQIPLSKQNTK